MTLNSTLRNSSDAQSPSRRFFETTQPLYFFPDNKEENNLRATLLFSFELASALRSTSPVIVLQSRRSKPDQVANWTIEMKEY
jgi:hypothetical protein